MPELPEVETIKLEIEKEIVGKTIKDVNVLSPRAINLSLKEFASKVKSKKIKSIQRRAKLLILELTDGLFLVIHLKLTGQLIYRESESKEKYTSVIFHFKDGSLLYFNDLRKFGYLKLLSKKGLTEFLGKMDFGLEPLDKKFTLEKFKELLRQKPRSKIKPLLMDQSFIAGIGNVYSQESCFCAKILPQRIVSSLKKEEIENLYKCLIKILREAIKKKGTSADTYLDIFGQEGGYLPFLKVYGRKGKKCFRCGATIEKINLAGRGTCFCPRCQR